MEEAEKTRAELVGPKIKVLKAFRKNIEGVFVFSSSLLAGNASIELVDALVDILNRICEGYGIIVLSAKIKSQTIKGANFDANLSNTCIITIRDILEEIPAWTFLSDEVQSSLIELLVECISLLEKLEFPSIELEGG